MIRTSIPAKHRKGIALASTAISSILLMGMAGCSSSAAPEIASAPLSCSTSSLQAAAPADAAITAAELVTAADGDVCKVTGVLTTRGFDAPPGEAHFLINLPANWNGKLLFLGGGGFDGMVPQASPAQIKAGYATLSTDSGHAASATSRDPGIDSSWMRNAAGQPDEAKLIDYAFRSREQVNSKLRPLVSQYYKGDKIKYSYFVGCSGGGREALIAAQRTPDAFDGFVAGSPVAGKRSFLMQARNFSALLKAPLTYKQIDAVGQAVRAQCDKRDDVEDGLIQNPGACVFDPKTLVAQGVLNDAQAKALTAYLSAVEDSSGRFVTYAAPITGIGDLSSAQQPAMGGLTGISSYITEPSPNGPSAQPWGHIQGGPILWALFNGVMTGMMLDDPKTNALGPDILDTEGRIVPALVEAADRKMAPYIVDPTDMKRFYQLNRKLIIYHGMGDAITDPYATLDAYRHMADTVGGDDKARDNIRLFMAPDVQHCGGGTGPNNFDFLAAMENWVERGVAPDAVVAAKYQNNNPRAAIERTMPLCPYPQMAKYNGTGDVNNASSWSCPAGDKRLLELDVTGKQAGLDKRIPWKQ